MVTLCLFDFILVLKFLELFLSLQKTYVSRLDFLRLLKFSLLTSHAPPRLVLWVKSFIEFRQSKIIRGSRDGNLSTLLLRLSRFLLIYLFQIGWLRLFDRVQKYRCLYIISTKSWRLTFYRSGLIQIASIFGGLIETEFFWIEVIKLVLLDLIFAT